jgi:ligand-binding sensor domain-containing protein
MPVSALCLLLRLACVWLLAAPGTAAASEGRPLNEYFRETWTTRQRLPHNLVQGVAQAPGGYLWFATWEGVVRYNGIEFRAFDRSNVAALADNGVRALLVTRDGTLVMGTSRGGVTLRRDGRWSAWTCATAWPRTRSWMCWRTAADACGSRLKAPAWIALKTARCAISAARRACPACPCIWPASPRTTACGCVARAGRRVEALSSDVRLPNNRVAALLEDHEGSIWVGTNGGLLRLRDAPYVTYTTEHGLADTYMRSVLQARDGTLWAGTSRGLPRWQGQHFAPAAGLPGPSWRHWSRHGAPTSPGFMASLRQTRTCWLPASFGRANWRDSSRAGT